MADDKKTEPGKASGETSDPPWAKDDADDKDDKADKVFAGTKTGDSPRAPDSGAKLDRKVRAELAEEDEDEDDDDDDADEDEDEDADDDENADEDEDEDEDADDDENANEDADEDADEEDEDEDDDDDEDDEDDEDEPPPRRRPGAATASRAALRKPGSPPARRTTSDTADDWIPDWLPWVVMVVLIALGAAGALGLFGSDRTTGGTSSITTPTPTAAAATATTTATGRRPPAADGETISAQHLLVQYKGATRAAPNVTRSKEEAKKRAQEALAKAKRGDEFGSLVVEYSDERGAAMRQGRLGRFTRQAMVKPFSDAAFALKPGEISGVVETDFGFHVIKRTE